MIPLRATARLQLHAGFTLHDALAQVPYYAGLGISHLYLSPIGTAVPDAAAFAEVAPTLLLQVLRGGLTLALPMMVAMLAVNLAFGALAKAAPALNPMQLGLPLTVLLGLFLLSSFASEFAPPVQRLFDSAFDAARALTG